MKQTAVNDIKINGITFLTFCRQLRGYSVLNKKGSEIPKFLLYWNRVTVDKIFSNYKIVARV